MERIKISWVDLGREPLCPSDPAHPEGVDIDFSRGRPSCMVSLPYPAARCGFYLVECSECHMRMLVTTAGRPDDPRSLKVACWGKRAFSH